MVLKANDRRTSCPCHDEFRGPRSDYVRQIKSKTWLAIFTSKDNMFREENAASAARGLLHHEEEVCLGYMPVGVSCKKWSDLLAFGGPAKNIHSQCTSLILPRYTPLPQCGH
ncbi:hypothetical protein TNCV_40261 [Trichonephila clavipes]|nr:hypothetical protein TNCV_40261 [Trichonephila clavipes]